MDLGRPSGHPPNKRCRGGWYDLAMVGFVRVLAWLFADSVGHRPSVAEPRSAALRDLPAGQLLRLAARAPVAPQGGA